jgi:hypothetical protein
LPSLKSVDAHIDNSGMPQTLGFQINYLKNNEDEEHINTYEVPINKKLKE